jgi:DNA-binding NarL/FixJ family response regulator
MAPPCRIKVLIAHADPLISAGLAATLRQGRDFETIVANAALTESPSTPNRVPTADVAIADYDSGLRLIASGGAMGHRVIVLSYNDSEAKISHALRQGARGYLLLGCSTRELLTGLRAVHQGGLALAPLAAARMADWLKQEALTTREREVLRQMMLGFSNKAIATKLTMAVGTVKTHVKAIFKKLDAASRTEAVAIAQRRGILAEECGWSPSEANPVQIGRRSNRTNARGGPEVSRLRPHAVSIGSF